MSAAPLQYLLHAAGPASAPAYKLGWALIGLVCAVMLIIAILLVGALARRRPKSPAGTEDKLPPDTGGMNWIVIGTGISSIALFAALVYAMTTLESVASPAHDPLMTIDVTSYDWWWKIEYTDAADSSRAFVTANEIHIPVGVPVRVELRSADVIHTFWAPQLAGKTEMIPGQTNEQWIEADTPGVYRGQCSQFCGVQHAHMAFEVVAQPRAEFDAWADAQRGGAQPVTTPDARTGQHIFGERCAGCHSVRGTPAAGMQAPDLTHLASRRLIAAGQTTNTPAHQLDWIEHAQRIKPGSLMPSIALSASDAAALSAYLSTLH
ncbi:cytochrome c oxidase subunit II [Trinickia dinghuensis]|uniref:Cytochrome aa3 subunit 2 n=1 Tax=Trinickia dinghuensis TaxID=2291023 RepID=A0A3D8JY58_9BURK|nr:cytochrome c oxidase subunit II [Trinickia dinghuensis]RDU97564.1 cytochrome c oxidase subunit II [Trinickia dinghuensis]